MCPFLCRQRDCSSSPRWSVSPCLFPDTFALRKRLLTLWPRKRPSTRTCPAAAAAGGGAALAGAVAAVAVAAGGGVGGTAAVGAVLAAAAGGVAAGGDTRSRACTECGLVGAQGVTTSFCLHGYCWWNVGGCVGRGLTGVSQSQRVSGASVWMGWLAAWRRGVRVEAAGGNRCVFGRGGTGCVRYVSTCASLARGNDTGALERPARKSVVVRYAAELACPLSQLARHVLLLLLPNSLARSLPTRAHGRLAGGMIAR